MMNRVVELFNGKNGLEIGGASPIFTKDGLIPIYPIVNGLDCCNFSKDTIWEGTIEEGHSFQFYNGKIGYRYICEAMELSEKISFKNYDFIISSNCLEHSANPLKVIYESLKVISSDGLLLIVVPKREATFDHNRPITFFSHIEKDFENDMTENDSTHFDEIIELHDLSKDPWAGTLIQFKERSLNNYYNRALHQHVFDMQLLEEIYEYFNLTSLFKSDMGGEYLIVGRKEQV
jgi:SAM-dependent methyltransferase